jgi:hypothetical protein
LFPIYDSIVRSAPGVDGDLVRLFTGAAVA